MLRHVSALAVVAGILAIASPANAHLPLRPGCPSLQCLLASQEANYGHSVYVAKRGGGKNKIWHKKATTWLSREHAKTVERLLNSMSVDEAISYYFGPYAAQAHRVVSCESGHSIYAQNGQYLGLFQMGDYARSVYGHGSTPREQVRAAYRYFVASGRDWSPWSCKPW